MVPRHEGKLAHFLCLTMMWDTGLHYSIHVTGDGIHSCHPVHLLGLNSCDTQHKSIRSHCIGSYATWICPMA
jgi:hypothetical protein